MVLEALAFGNHVIFSIRWKAAATHAPRRRPCLPSVTSLPRVARSTRQGRLVQEHYRHDQVVAALLQMLGSCRNERRTVLVVVHDYPPIRSRDRARAQVLPVPA